MNGTKSAAIACLMRRAISCCRSQVVFYCLGTTRSDAGSAANFKKGQVETTVVVVVVRFVVVVVVVRFVVVAVVVRFVVGCFATAAVVGVVVVAVLENVQQSI